MATLLRPATEDDLEDRSRRGVRCELVDGEIREMSPAGVRHGVVTVKILALLFEHVRRNGLGHVLESSTGFRLPSGNVRSPDVRTLAPDDVLDGGDVVAGLRCRPSDFL